MRRISIALCAIEPLADRHESAAFLPIIRRAVDDRPLALFDDRVQMNPLKGATTCVLAATGCLTLVAWFAYSHGQIGGFANGSEVARRQYANAAALASWANTPEGELGYALAKAGSLRELATCLTSNSLEDVRNTVGSWASFTSTARGARLSTLRPGRSSDGLCLPSRLSRPKNATLMTFPFDSFQRGLVVARR